MPSKILGILVGAVLAIPGSATAQRIPFERTFEMSTPVTLDVATANGKITVTAGEPGRVTVRGTATVRVGVQMATTGLEQAQRLAANPPIERTADRVQLRVQANATERRAVTIAYEVTVPPGSIVTATSDSGEIAITGITGAVTARTQSSSITLQGLRSAVFVRTGSGAVAAAVGPASDVDIETSSSAVTVTGGARALHVKTSSGRIGVTGTPTDTWDLDSGSGRIELALTPASAVTFDLSGRSGTITAPPVATTTERTKLHAAGTLNRGGARLTARSGSGGVILSVGR